MCTTVVTQQMIADELGLSRVAVSQALRGTGRIPETTRRRILAAAKRLGYRGNASARAVRSGRHGAVALLTSDGPTTSSALDHRFIGRVQRRLARLDTLFAIASVGDEELADEARVAELLARLSVDGLFLGQEHALPRVFLRLLRHYHVPWVWLNYVERSNAVYPDERLAGRLLTEHLLGLGHLRIAYVDSGYGIDPAPHYSRTDRYAGYEEALQASGGEPLLVTTPPGSERKIQIVEVLRGELSKRRRPTAFIAYSAGMAISVLFAAVQAGLAVPRDLSICCFSSGGRIVDPAGNRMTAAIIPWGEISHRAADMLFERIDAGGRSRPSIAAAPELQVGETTGPAA